MSRRVVGGIIAAGALTAGAIGAYAAFGPEGEPGMSAEACAPFQDGLQVVYNAEAAGAGKGGVSDNAEANELRAQAAAIDGEEAVSKAKEQFLMPYREAVAQARIQIESIDSILSSDSGTIPGGKNRSEAEDLRLEAEKIEAQDKLEAAEATEDEAEQAADLCEPASPTSTTQPQPGAGLTGTGEESRYHIAGEGSCSPYTQADGLAAQAGKYDGQTSVKDLSDVEVGFLQQYPEFAKNMAMTSEGRWGFAYDALNIPRPSVNTEGANKSVEAMFASEYYVTAPLAEALTIQNTYCDKDGNIIDYRPVTLEASTYVGGMLIDMEEFNPATGMNEVTLKNGNKMSLPANAAIATVAVTGPDGQPANVRMLAWNKAGVSVDADAEAEIGCENWIDLVAVYVAPPSETPATGGPAPTRPGQPTTTRGATTTVPQNTTSTRPELVTPAPPAVGGPQTPETDVPDQDNDPDNNPIVVPSVPPQTGTTIRPLPPTSVEVPPTLTPTTPPRG